MERTPVATGLGVVATLGVLAAAVAAGTTYLVEDGSGRPAVAGSAEPAGAVTVHAPRSGATFEVPGTDAWTVRDAGHRIYYAGADGRPEAVVHGPAVFRDGYCAARPEDSNRGFVGFTRQDFATWTDAVARSDGRGGGWSTGVDRRRVTLADGNTARLSSSDLFL